MKLNNTSVNILVALLILLAFAIVFVPPFFLCFALVEFAWRIAWPRIADHLAVYGPPSTVVDFGFLEILAFFFGIQSLRRSNWKGAALSFGLLIAVVVTWFQTSRAAFTYSIDFLLLGTCCWLSIPSAIRSLRKRFWTSAVLSVMVFVAFLLPLTAASGPANVSSLTSLLIALYLIPGNRHLAHWEFLLIATSVLLSALSGFGPLGNSRWLDDTTTVAEVSLVAWFVYRMRKGESFEMSMALANKPSRIDATP